MARVRYLSPEDANPQHLRRLVLVRQRRTDDHGEFQAEIRDNILARSASVTFVAPRSAEGLLDTIGRASNYADGCGIKQIFVRDAQTDPRV